MSAADTTNGDVIILGEGGEVPEGYERVQLYSTYMHGMSYGPDGDFRFYQNYHKDGRVDGRRSRYWVNGKCVSLAAFKAAGGMS